MKRYFLINSLWTWWAERVVSNLANRLCKKHEITIITLFDDKAYELDQKISYQPLYKTKSIIKALFILPRTISKLRKKYKHYDNWVSFLERSNFIHIISRKSAIISFRTTRNFFSWVLGQLYKIGIKLLYPHAKIIIVNAEENQDKLKTQIKKVPPIEVIYNPIDQKETKNHPIPSELQNKIQNKIIFITVCRLIKTRHIDQILQTLYRRNNHPDYIYIIVWDWPEKNKLEKITRKLWLQNLVIFTGYQKSVYQYLQIADYFLYASSVEWFPNSLLESIHRWIPVITKDFTTGAREAIMWSFQKSISYPRIGKNGILLSPQTFQTQLLEILKSLDTIKFNPKLGSDHDTQTITTQREKLFKKCT